MIKFKVNQSNYKTLSQLAEVLQQNKVKRIEIEPTNQIEDLPKFSEIVPFLYQILDYELFFQVWLKNIPYCVINSESVDHILSDDSYKGEKIKECQSCLWNNRCPGFPKDYLTKYGSEEICPMPDLPWEVMIEVTSHCNFKCKFCFNQISFAEYGRKIKEFSTDYLKKIIDEVAKKGIKIIRFTGGEPLLRKDIFELLKYSKNKGLEVRLNTNASLINQKVARKFRNVLDNVLIPIESYNDREESRITGYSHSLKKKIEAIKLLKKAKIPVVRAGTVATKENILSFDKIAQLISQLPLDEWELYRPIPISKKNDLNSKLIKLLVEKLIDLRKKTAKPVFIANALPFCAMKDLNKLNSISKGGLYDDGHTRLVIDPRGFVKPHYFMDENIGNPLDILSAWQHPFVKKMRNLEYLPQQCQGCPFVFKCRGGSRQVAKIIYGDYQALDPLASPKNAL
ncbi:MAG: radical SAM protein [Candidatus Portnoybacteria bacterium]|nr:radical SAM protein [Candidatus Portnoybacteria bacterium]